MATMSALNFSIGPTSIDTSIGSIVVIDVELMHIKGGMEDTIEYLFIFGVGTAGIGAVQSEGFYGVAGVGGGLFGRVLQGCILLLAGLTLVFFGK